jgi:anti-anti-sigma factor
MGIQDWSTDVILVDLPRGLEGHAELKTVTEMTRNRGTCNVVVDFSNVDLVGSQAFASLLELRQVLLDSGHKLALCGLRPATKGVFVVARLDNVFEFVEDRFAALAKLQIVA